MDDCIQQLLSTIFMCLICKYLFTENLKNMRTAAKLTRS